MIREVRERLGAHGGLHVRPTTIRDSRTNATLPMFGAFAPPNVMRGDCIGFYTGVHCNTPLSGKSSNRNAMVIDDETIIIPRNHCLRAGHHPITRVNEPPPGVAANCEFKCWYSAREVLPESRIAPGRRAAVAVILPHASSLLPICSLCSVPYCSPRRSSQMTLHATRDLVDGEEIYATYGSTYATHRDYPVGSPPAHPLRKQDITLAQRPAATRMAHVCAVRGLICAVEYALPGEDDSSPWPPHSCLPRAAAVARHFGGSAA